MTTQRYRITLITTFWLLVLAAMGVPAFAEDATAQQRASFRKLVSERNALHRELRELDARAAEAIKAGDETASLYAKQVSVQDQLDLVMLRLETTAARYGLPLPDVPETNTAARQTRGDRAAKAAQRAFTRGQTRALDELRRQALAMLASIDFEAFLNGPMTEE